MKCKANLSLDSVLQTVGGRGGCWTRVIASAIIISLSFCLSSWLSCDPPLQSGGVFGKPASNHTILCPHPSIFTGSHCSGIRTDLLAVWAEPYLAWPCPPLQPLPHCLSPGCTGLRQVPACFLPSVTIY